MDNQEELKQKQRFRARGAHLGELLGDLFYMSEGESVEFYGRVFLFDENNNEHNFGLNNSLMKLIKGKTNEDFSNYRLIGVDVGFSVPLTHVSDWAMIKEHPISEKNRNGPFLYADLRMKGYIIIESPKNPFPEVTESDTFTDGAIEVKKVHNPYQDF